MEGPAQNYISRDEEDEMEVAGYRPCPWKLVLVTLGTLCSGGFLLLFLYWLPQRSVCWTCHRASLRDACMLLLRTDEFRTWSRVWVHNFWALARDPLGCPQSGDGSPEGPPEAKGLDCKQGLLPMGQMEVRFFIHHQARYLLDPADQDFHRLTALDAGVPCSTLHGAHSAGLPLPTQAYRWLFYGDNLIDVRVPSLLKLLIKEVLNPFYVFQVFSMVLWVLDDYYYYAVAILFMTVLSAIFALHAIHKQYIPFHDMVAAHNVVRVTVSGGTTAWRRSCPRSWFQGTWCWCHQRG